MARFYESTPGGFPRDQRQQRLTEIDAEILSLEKAEEEHVVVAQGYNVNISRRSDVRPEVVLGID